MAGAVAGAFDIDVVALAPEQHPSKRVLATLRTVVSGWSEASRVHLEAILGKTGGAAAAVGRLARPGDVVVTPSCLVAREVLGAGGHAIDNWGERYTNGSIAGKVLGSEAIGHAARAIRVTEYRMRVQAVLVVHDVPFLSRPLGRRSLASLAPL